MKVESGALCGPCTSVCAVASYVRDEIAKAPRVALEALRELDRSSPLQKLRDRSIARLEAVDIYLEGVLQALLIQKKLDDLGAYLEKKFSVFTPFHTWLLENGQGEWYQQLALFLAKLPLRSACNIVQLLYGIVRTACYTAVHPMKSVNNLAKLLVRIIYELTKPETWSKIGAGMVGAGLGQAAVGNPLSPLAIGIGAALIGTGVSLGSIKAAVLAQDDGIRRAVKENLLGQGAAISECLLTGFITGLLIGVIQKTIHEHQLKAYKHQVENLTAMTYEEAKKFVDDLVRKLGLPQYDSIKVLDGGRQLEIVWEPKGVFDYLQVPLEKMRVLCPDLPDLNMWYDPGPGVGLGTEYWYTHMKLTITHSKIPCIDVGYCIFSQEHYRVDSLCSWTRCTTLPPQDTAFLFSKPVPLVPAAIEPALGTGVGAAAAMLSDESAAESKR